MKIGCIGQGFVGKSLSDDLVSRGFDIEKYALEPEYLANKDKIPQCDVVFIAVPTPTTPEGPDSSIVEESIGLVGEGKIVVIKSTIVPGTTKKLQDKNPNKIILFSPELLLERTAAFDAAHPLMNVIGVAYDTAVHRKAAQQVRSILPHAEHNFIVSAQAAELYKYAHNINGYMRILLTNLLFDLGEENDVNWSDVKLLIDSDTMMSPYYNTPVHKGGRGAGGNCFVKDLAAFRHAYETQRPGDDEGIGLLRALERKNLELLAQTKKDQDIVRRVYGDKKP